MAVCPECDAEITLGSKVLVGEIISCPDCGVELEVVSLNPPQLDLAPQEEEDWGE
jgi:alpha-aminoadipate/glutamate carrier protein LysW